MKLLVLLILVLVFATGCAMQRVPAQAQLPAAPTQTHQPAPLKLKIVATNGHRVLTEKQLIDELAKYNIVCVGEIHDSELHHRVQLEIIQGLSAHRGRMGVGMEMFQRPFQPDIDRYFAGQTTEAEFLKATEYDTRWGFDWQLYSPIVDFARANKIPLAALNAPKELTNRIMKVGYSGLTDDEKRQLGPVDFNVKAHRDFWYEIIPQMHGAMKPSAQQQERTYEVMTVWDDYMAQSVASFYHDRHLRRLVVLAGSGHIDGGFGIPDRAAKYAHAKRATVKTVIGDQSADGSDDGLPTDYTIYVLPDDKQP
ncbi:MAG TPA: ChaN family lipoprotein [Planktothrix sp.]|jgi:uncharacterized iron-regulated protein